MSSIIRTTEYRMRDSPPRKSSSSSSYSTTKNRHVSRSHSQIIPPNSSQESVSSLSRHSLSDADEIIALMGMTGSGKSTFINLVCNEKVGVGHSLESYTTKVDVASFTIGNSRRGYLVDTPGFDDTNRSDTEILKEIAGFLTKLYTRRIRVSGLVYMHRITDPRMQGSALKNLEVFRKLAGEDAFPNVALVGTRWQELRGSEGKRLGESHEADLRSNDEFWGSMVKEGSRIFRHFGDRGSATEIVQWLLDRPNKVILKIQRELVDNELMLDQTEAGQSLQKASAGARRKYEKEIEQLQAQIDQAHNVRDSQTESDLLLERIDAEGALERVERSARQMRIDARQLEVEMDQEYIVRVDEMEREGQEPTSPDVSALREKLKEARDQIMFLEQDQKQKEKEFMQEIEAIRRQDNAKARNAIARLQARFSEEQKRSEARSRAQTQMYQELEDEYRRERAARKGASKAVGFFKNLVAPALGFGYDQRSLYDENYGLVMSPRRVRTNDSSHSHRSM